MSGSTEVQFAHRPLHDRCGVITGALGGIGRVLCAAFTAAGARVAMLDIEEAALQAQASTCVGAIATAADISSENQVTAAIDCALGSFGRLDFLINNAGVRYECAFLDHDLSSWRRTLDVNLTGSFLCARAACRIMVERGGGSIVNIASVAAQSAFRGRAAYVASKSALLGLTRAIAWELGPRGIRCNAIAPGIIETALTSHYFEDETRAAGIREQTPARRWGQPEDLSGAAIFLCGPGADFVQGATLCVDGGWLAGKGY